MTEGSAVTFIGMDVSKNSETHLLRASLCALRERAKGLYVVHAPTRGAVWQLTRGQVFVHP